MMCCVQLVAKASQSVKPLYMHIDSTGPLCLDFGRVVVRSTVEKHVSVRNFLTKHISIRMKVHTNSLAAFSIYYYYSETRGIVNVSFHMLSS